MALWMAYPPVLPVYGTCGITVSRDAESIGDTFSTWGGVYIPQPEITLLFEALRGNLRLH